jgi:hypothetical protein
MAAILSVPQKAQNWFPNCSVNICSGQKKETLVYSSRAAVMKLSIVAPTLRQFAAYMISAVPEVEYVLTMCDDENRLLRVFSVIDAFDSRTRENIYAKEGQVIDEFEDFNFEFNIVSRRGKPLSECITDPGLEVTFQRK